MKKCFGATICLFDKWSLTVPDNLEFHQDGPMGKRVVFITDAKESFCISFEEGMLMLPQVQSDASSVSFQCRKGGKYIHLRRGNKGRVSFAFFHMELEDKDGRQHTLAGQMVISAHYQWCDGVEPVLLEVLENISVLEGK